MPDPQATEHIKVARRLHFQGMHDEAISEYQAALSYDPGNEDAISGLRALGVEPAESSPMMGATAGSAVKTNFFVNQAKSGEVSVWKTAPFKVVVSVIALVALYGIYQGVMMFLNFDNIKALENVEAAIQKIRTKEGGDTYADVRISNYNPAPIKNVVISYTLIDVKGNTIKDSSLTIKTPIPAGDTRTFTDIDLGNLREKPSDVKQKPESLIYGPKPKKLNERLAAKFIEATQKPDRETFGDFDEITQDAEDWPPALIGMGRAYAARGDYKRAIEQYKKAIDSDPDNANAHYYMAVALYYNKDMEKARQEIDKAAALAPDDPQIAYSQRSLFAGKKTEKTDTASDTATQTTSAASK